jgi:poly-beta-1,6-N-acetyl-D-glucosamine synthase
MTILFFIFFIFLFFYILLLVWLAIGFLKTKEFVSAQKFLQIPITIIISARNEEQKIVRCLKSILQQSYVLNKIQLLLINDASTDGTVFRAEYILKNSGINYKIISNATHKGKKESITYAMQFADNNLIVMRDADTFTHSNLWLQTISDYYQNTKSDFIIAPIAIQNNFGFLWAIQVVENNILQLISCGSAYFNKPFLCSGANLIFTKHLFQKTNGYSSHSHVASGDDVLFMEDVKKISNTKISFLKAKDAIVFTYPCYSIASLINQKIRWASKFKVNSNKLNFIVALLSFFSNTAWIVCFIYVYFFSYLQLLALSYIFIKLLIDILLLFLATRFTKSERLLWFSLPVGFVYAFYACTIGVLSFFIKPKWK